MRRALLLLVIFVVAVSAQSPGVGSIWSTVNGTLQSGAVANGNGSTLAVNGLSSVIYTVNCSVACSGGTTINFEGSADGTNYVALNTVQLGTSTAAIATTVVNQGTTITAWQVSVAGLQLIRARISAYSAGTITVTANATAASYDPKIINGNVYVGGALLGIGQQTASASLPVILPSATVTTLTPPAAITNYANEAGGNLATLAGAVSASVIQQNIKQIGGSAVYVDPCMVNTPLKYVVNFATATTTTMIAGTSGKQTYICGISILPTSAAVNINIVEGTGTNCSSISAGLIGGTTAATGPNLSVNGGFVMFNGGYWVTVTTTAADNVCYMASATSQVSGVIKYVQQ